MSEPTNPLQEPFAEAVVDTSNTAGRLREQGFWFGFLRFNVLLVVGVLVLLLWFLLSRGLHVAWSWEFLSQMPRDGMTAGGILPAIVGTLCLTAVSMAIAIPLGVLSAIYLNEYAQDNWFTRLINISVTSLAGVPSIVHGLFGVGAFVHTLHLGKSLMAAACTIAVMTIPVIITATRESLNAVPMPPSGLLSPAFKVSNTAA